MIRSYLELVELKTFEERFRYLQLGGTVGETTFGFERYLNQKLYSSQEWKRIRDKVIIRDEGCDLGIEGYDIYSHILIHHINPITIEDVINRTPALFDMNNLICTKKSTHDALHYGDDSYINTQIYIPRRPNDTCPWKK